MVHTSFYPFPATDIMNAFPVQLPMSCCLRNPCTAAEDCTRPTPLRSAPSTAAAGILRRPISSEGEEQGEQPQVDVMNHGLCLTGI